MLSIIIPVVAFFFYQQSGNEEKQRLQQVYQPYKRAVAKIVGKDSNGRVGKSHSTIVRLQFPLENGEFSVKELTNRDFPDAEIPEGDVVLYYDPQNPYNVVLEEEYLSVMK